LDQSTELQQGLQQKPDSLINNQNNTQHNEIRIDVQDNQNNLQDVQNNLQDNVQVIYSV